MVENTLLVTPVLRSGFDGKVKDFGRVFEQVFTQHASPGQKGSHHRVIRYSIGPLRCLVLFECDAQINDISLRSLEETGFTWMQPPTSLGGQALHDSIAQQLQPSVRKERHRFHKLSPAAIEAKHLQAYTPPFNVIHDGKGTLSSQIAELVSSVSMSPKKPKTAQMWLGRTPVGTPVLSRVPVPHGHTLTLTAPLVFGRRETLQ